MYTFNLIYCEQEDLTVTHYGEKARESRGEQIAIYHNELQFNSIQLNFIIIPLNLSHCDSSALRSKGKLSECNDASQSGIKTIDAKTESRKEDKTMKLNKSVKCERKWFIGCDINSNTIPGMKLLMNIQHGSFNPFNPCQK